MTATERSRRYRKISAGDRQHTSFGLSRTAHKELQRIAGQAGLSATGALLVAIHQLSMLPPEDIADLAPTVSKLYGQRIELVNPDGSVSRVKIGGYGR